MFEIDAGSLALTKSPSAGVKTYGYLMITNHKELGSELEAIAKRLHLHFPKTMGKSNHDTYERLKRLPDAAFDKHYLEHMVEGHMQAVQLFSTAPKELRPWATESLPVICQHLHLALLLDGKPKTTLPFACAPIVND